MKTPDFAARHARKAAAIQARKDRQAAFLAKKRADGFKRYDIAKARALYLEGLPQSEVARRVGVHFMTIHHMVHREFPEIVTERARKRLTAPRLHGLWSSTQQKEHSS